MKEEGQMLRNVVESFAWEWHDFKRALRGIDKTSFEELLQYAKNQIRSSCNIHHYNLFEVIVLSILLEHENQINQLRDRQDPENK